MLICKCQARLSATTDQRMPCGLFLSVTTRAAAAAATSAAVGTRRRRWPCRCCRTRILRHRWWGTHPWGALVSQQRLPLPWLSWPARQLAMSPVRCWLLMEGTVSRASGLCSMHHLVAGSDVANCVKLCAEASINGSRAHRVFISRSKAMLCKGAGPCVEQQLRMKYNPVPFNSLCTLRGSDRLLAVLSAVLYVVLTFLMGFDPKRHAAAWQV